MITRSGDTFLFTSYLAAAAPGAWTIAPATSVSWPPVPGEQSARGNRELLDLLRNHVGAYVLPTNATSPRRSRASPACSATPRSPRRPEALRAWSLKAISALR
jgi:hypothetical protein